MAGEMSVDMRQMLSSLLDDACLHIPKINNAVKRIEGLKMLLYMKRDVAKVKLREVVTQIQQNTAGLQNKIEGEIDEKTMEKERRMKSEKERLMEHIRSVAAECTNIEELLEAGREDVIVEQGSLVAERLETLMRRNVTANLDDMNYLELVFQRSRSDDHLSEIDSCVYVRSGILDPQTMRVLTRDGSAACQAYIGMEEMVTLVTSDNEHVKNGMKFIEVIIKDPKTRVLPYKLSDNQDGTYTVLYTPEVLGPHTFTVKVYGSNILGSPLCVFVTDFNSELEESQSQTATSEDLDRSPMRRSRSRIRLNRNILNEVKKHIAQNPPVRQRLDLPRPSSSARSHSESVAERKEESLSLKTTSKPQTSCTWRGATSSSTYWQHDDTARVNPRSWGGKNCDAENTTRPDLMQEVCIEAGRTEESWKAPESSATTMQGSTQPAVLVDPQNGAKSEPLSNTTKSKSPTVNHVFWDSESSGTTISPDTLPTVPPTTPIGGVPDSPRFSLQPEKFKMTDLNNNADTEVLWDEGNDLTSSDSGIGKTISCSPSWSSATPSHSHQASPLHASSPKSLRVPQQQPQPEPCSASGSEDLWLSAKEFVTKSKNGDPERQDLGASSLGQAGGKKQPGAGIILTAAIEHHLRQHSERALKATLVKRIGKKGNGRKELMCFPIGVTVNAVTKDILVCDSGNNLLKCFLWETGTHKFSVGDSKESACKLSRPSAVVTNSAGEIFVKDNFAISVLDKDGQLLHTINKPRLLRPFGLDMTPSGDLVLLDHGRMDPQLLVYHQDGSLVSENQYMPIHGPQRSGAKCRFMSIHGDDVIFADLGKSKVYVTDLQGKGQVKFGFFGCKAGEFREPSGVTHDSYGNLLIADSKNNRIQIFRPDGTYHGRLDLSAEITRPSDIHLTSDGHLLVCNFLEHCVKIFKLESSTQPLPETP